jgi:hypothetical protein
VMPIRTPFLPDATISQLAGGHSTEDCWDGSVPLAAAETSTPRLRFPHASTADRNIVPVGSRANMRLLHANNFDDQHDREIRPYNFHRFGNHGENVGYDLSRDIVFQ